MAETGPITIAVAGAGDTTEANVEALLNDLLGFGDEGDDGYYVDSDREEINVFFPASKTHSNKNLDKVVAWTAKANLPFYVAVDEDQVEKPDRKMKTTLADAEEVKEVSDVNAELIDVLEIAATNGQEAYLILLFGDDEEGPSDEIYDLLEAADAAGIQVKDLTAGLDDIKITDDAAEAEPEPDPEPEPEPEKPTRRGRGRKAAAEEQKVEETPLEETKVTADEARAAAAEAKEKGAAAKAAARKKVDDALEAKKATPDLPHDRQTESSLGSGSVLVSVDDLTGLYQTLAWAADYLAAVDTSNAYVNLSDEVKPRPLTQVVVAATNWLKERLGTPSEATGDPESDEQTNPAAEVPPEATGPRKSRGRPRKDGTPAQPKDPDEPTITVFEDEDGNLTKAGRGRPPKGQKRTKITEAEAREAGLL